MRTRAYRPEFPRCLEDRSLLSGVAGPSADPVLFSRTRLNFIVTHMENGFYLFTRYRDVAQLGSEIDDVVGMLPFVQADGVRASIVNIVNRMQRNLSARVPYSIRSARNEVIDVVRSDLLARVQAGDLVVR